jgi:cytochrome d ubiquinol oxidase subunit II
VGGDPLPPAGLAALGIVVRGAGFAFRKVLVRTDQQRLTGAAFAVSSVLTPFFFGAVAGGIASGRVPPGGHGDPIASGVNPTSILGGVLAVLVCAYTAAVFLTAEARRHDDTELETWFRRRTLATAWPPAESPWPGSSCCGPTHPGCSTPC